MKETHLNQNSRRERFYKAYGKHVLKIEVILVSVLTLTFIVPVVFWPVTVLFLWSWFAASAVGSFMHSFIYLKLANKELYPYEILLTGRFRSYLTWTVYVSLLLWILSSYALLLFSSVLQTRNILSDLLGYLAFLLVPLSVVLACLSIVSISSLRKARLSLAAVLIGLMRINDEKEQPKRAKLARKYLGWFKVGLASYNGYLFRQPIHVKILNIDYYYHGVCCAALLGSKEQIDPFIEQTRCALNSMDGKGTAQLKNLLIALKRIRDPRTKKVYTLSELSEMVRITSFLDRLCEIARHPLFKFLVGSPVIWGAISLFLKWLKLL